jgi:hypothetical protein
MKQKAGTRGLFGVLARTEFLRRIGPTRRFGPAEQRDIMVVHPASARQ